MLKLFKISLYFFRIVGLAESSAVVLLKTKRKAPTLLVDKTANINLFVEKTGRLSHHTKGFVRQRKGLFSMCKTPDTKTKQKH